MLSGNILKKSDLEEELKNLSEIPQIPFEEIKSQIRKKEIIGSGGLGIVYGCIWKDKKCAIKEIILQGNRDLAISLFQELKIMAEIK